MNYQEFLQEIKVTIGQQIDAACTVDIKQVQKNNGTILDGLIIMNPSINIAPTIYLNPYYHRYLNGQSINDIYEDIISTYKSVMPQEDFDVEFFTDYNRVEKTIIMKLINYEQNIDFLSDVPHVRFHDLAIIFQSLVSSKNGETGTITIHASHLDFWNITTDKLYETALENTPKLLQHEIINITSIIDLPDKDIDPNMYIITNKAHVCGAACILYKGVLKEFAQKLDSDLILIPSSIHEFIIVPSSVCWNLDYFNTLIGEVNATSVADDEILSDHAYYYSLSSDKII